MNDSAIIRGKQYMFQSFDDAVEFYEENILSPNWFVLDESLLDNLLPAESNSTYTVSYIDNEEAYAALVALMIVYPRSHSAEAKSRTDRFDSS